MRAQVIFCVVLTLFLTNCAVLEKFGQKKQEELSLDSGLDILVDQIIVSLSQNQKSKIAIIEFSDIVQGEITTLGKYIAEELTTRLYRTSKFDVIERQLMNKLLKEQELGLTGYIDDDTAVLLGRIFGVDAIASGSITDLGEFVKVNARLISAETGKVFSVASVKIPKDDTVRLLLNQHVKTKSETSTSKSAKNRKPDKGNKVIEEFGLHFEIIGADVSSRKAIIQIKISNKGENDIEFGMILGWPKQYKTMCYDNNGTEYYPSAVKFGATTQRFKNITSYEGASIKVISGISTVIELQFDQISSQATDISLLQINCTRKMGMLEFRDIKLGKKNQ